MADLFGEDAPAPPKGAELARDDAPLADRLRPRDLSEVIGQEHLTGPEGAIGRMVAAGKLSSMMLWGPPGTGKTSIARLLAASVGMRFTSISAVFSGVADLKKAFAEADKMAEAGKRTLLFVDEIHRFNRAQQDGFLPFVERGTITLVGATTENPSFALNAALLSRAQVLILERLSHEALGALLTRAEELEGSLPSPPKRARLLSPALMATGASCSAKRKRSTTPRSRNRSIRKPSELSSNAASPSTTRIATGITISSARSTKACAGLIRKPRSITSRVC